MQPTNARPDEAESRPLFATSTAASAPGSVVPGLGPPSAPGDLGTLGVYRVTRLVGGGGMGTVYAALDTRLDRPVALKVMQPQFAADPKARFRFLREARAAAQVTGDHVVTVYDADEQDGVPYLVMPLLAGCSLDEYLKRSDGPDPELAARVAREAALGLEAVHKAGLVHRDVKPGNLWLEGPDGRVKVIDFGLARFAEGGPQVSDPGELLGTPAYMSPEQARCEPVDHRTDLYSLGAVLYKLCTGLLPFPGATARQVIEAVKAHSPPPRPVLDLNPTVPADLAALVHRLMAPNPADRPATAAEAARMAAALATPGGGPVTVTHVQATGERRPKRRRAVAVALGLALAAVAAAAGVVVIIRNRDGSETRVEVPDGGALLLTPGPQPPPAKDAPRSDQARPEPPGFLIIPAPAPAPTDREAAEYALSIGGWVQVDTKQGLIKSPAELPGGRFALNWADLHGTALTDAGMAHFRGCADLQRVGVGETAVTDAGLAHLKGCRKLIGLAARGNQVTDAGLAHLKGCTELQDLYLDRTAVTDAGLAHLAGHKAFVLLELSHTAVTDAGLAHLAGCTRLEKVYLSGTRVTDAGLAALGDSKGLRELRLIDTAVGDAGLAHVRDCPNLYYIGLDGTRVTDKGLIHFKNCKGLYNIGLAGTRVTDAGLVHFRDCPDLGELYLDRTAVTDAGLSNFKSCKRLTAVHLTRTGVTDAGLRQFAGAEALEWLFVDDTAVTDTGLAHLKGCNALTNLGAGCPGVTDAGLAHLKGVPNLTWLRLGNSGVTDAGLAHLKDCKGLKWLGLAGTKVTAKGVAEFHAARPDCRIEYDGGVLEPKP